MNKESKCVIILSYIEHFTQEYLNEMCNNAALVICADGGYDIAVASNIKPDVIIGDCDSQRVSQEHADILQIRYPSVKDFTDAEACLKYAIEQHHNEIIMLGGIGGRLDHTIGALALLLKFADTNARIWMQDMSNKVMVLKDGQAIINKTPDYKYLSIISASDISKGVSASGVKYPLNNSELVKDTTLGISNEITANCAIIEVSNGSLYIIQSKDND